MKHIKSSVVAMAGLVLATATSHAGLTPVQTVANGELSLDNIMATVYGTGYTRIDDSSDIAWTATGASANFEAIYAGSSQNLYTSAPGNTTPNSTPSPIITAVGGSTLVSLANSQGNTVNFSSASSPFLFLDVATGPSITTVNSSDPALNGGVDHMVTYLVTQYLLAGGGVGTFSQPTYVIAFEDYTDFDYNDLVVQVQGVSPVPEPTTIVAGALLLLPLGASALRGFRKNRIA